MTPDSGWKPAYSKRQVDRAGRMIAGQVGPGRRSQAHTPSPALLEASQTVEWWRDQHEAPLFEAVARLRRHLTDLGEPAIAQRLKRVPTIAGKLRRQPQMRLTQMADIAGLRVVLPGQDQAHRVADRLQRSWAIVRFRDYVARPKPDGYRALHLIAEEGGRLVEVQLRTPDQETWANFVERLSLEIAPDLKFGGGPADLKCYLVLSAEVMASLDGAPSQERLASRIRAFKVAADILVERVIHAP